MAVIYANSFQKALFIADIIKVGRGAIVQFG